MTAKEYYKLLVAKTRQNLLPASENGFCKHLTSTGRKCPVGLLMPVDSPWLTLHCAIDDIDPAFMESIMPVGMNVEALKDMQRLHDRVATMSDTWSVAEKMFYIRSIHEYFKRFL